MALQEADIAAHRVAIGLDGARRGAPLVGQMGQPIGQGPRCIGLARGGGQVIGHRSAVHSTTRAMKAINSAPISGAKA